MIEIVFVPRLEAFLFSPKVTCDTYPSDIHTSLILLGYCIKPTKVNLYLQRGCFVFIAPAKKQEILKREKVETFVVGLILI